MKFTPGPWKVYHEVFRPQLCNKKIIEVQTVDNKTVIPWIAFDSVDMPKKEILANAHLIASAPYMHHYLSTLAMRGDKEAKALIAWISMIPKRGT